MSATVIRPLAITLKEKPDLIVLDLGLPAGDGFAVLKSVYEYPALSNVLVIVLTGRDSAGNERRPSTWARLLFSEAGRRGRVAASDSRQPAGYPGAGAGPWQ